MDTMDSGTRPVIPLCIIYLYTYILHHIVIEVYKIVTSMQIPYKTYCQSAEKKTENIGKFTIIYKFGRKDTPLLKSLSVAV